MPKDYILSPLEKKAWDFAEDAHKGVNRKFTGLPYFEHVKKVFKLVKKVDVREELGCAALLHDVVEDTDYSYDDIKKEFGLKISKLVNELTSYSEMIDVMGKSDYLLDKMATMSDDALVIKLCDRFQNLSDHYASSDKFRVKYYDETKYIIDSLKENRQLNRKQLTIISWIEGLLETIERRYIKKFDSFKYGKS
jgi:GTP pyrophosphokinase